MRTSFLTLAMNVSFLAAVLALLGISKGAFYKPRAYRIQEIVSVNGSNADGGCPPMCVGMEGQIRACNCPSYASQPPEATTGVLFDGTVPTIDVTERNNANEFVWAAPLFTMRGTTGKMALVLQYGSSQAVREIELYIFHCPSWGIGAEVITVYLSPAFPQFYDFLGGIASVTLTNSMEDCNSLTRISIPIDESYNNYAIEFTLGAAIEWVFIGEMRLSDQPIPTPIPVTAVPGVETTTAEADMEQTVPRPTTVEEVTTPTTEVDTTAEATTMEVATTEDTTEAIEITTTQQTTTMEVATTEDTTEAIEVTTTQQTTTMEVATTEDTTEAIEAITTAEATTMEVATTEDTTEAIEATTTEETTTMEVATTEDTTEAIEATTTEETTTMEVATTEDTTETIEATTTEETTTMKDSITEDTTEAIEVTKTEETNDFDTTTEAVAEEETTTTEAVEADTTAKATTMKEATTMEITTTETGEEETTTTEAIGVATTATTEAVAEEETTTTEAIEAHTTEETTVPTTHTEAVAGEETTATETIELDTITLREETTAIAQEELPTSGDTTSTEDASATHQNATNVDITTAEAKESTYTDAALSEATVSSAGRNIDLQIGGQATQQESISSFPVHLVAIGGALAVGIIITVFSTLAAVSACVWSIKQSRKKLEKGIKV